MRRVVVALAAMACVFGISPVVAAAAGPSVTVDVAPASPTVGDEVTVSGDVTDADGRPVANAALTATRSDSAGDHQLMVDMANSSGHYAFQDTPTAYGQVTWTVTWHGAADVDGHQTATVDRNPTSLSLTASAATVRTGTSVDLTAHLDSATTDRTVSIYARPYGQHRRLVEQGTVDASGELHTSYDVQRTTTFLARFDGDDTYAPADDHQRTRARARVADQLDGGYGDSGGYRLYHVGDNANVRAQLFPETGAACLYFRAQRRQSGQWRTTAVSDCLRTDDQGRVNSKFKGDRALIDKPYRVRAEWPGSPGALRDAGPWRQLRFRG